jgi:peptidoglycan/LPS O-acetylase OafA/YrhL
MKAKKIMALEALRGIAAVVVLVWHSILGFVPQITDNYSGAQKSSFQMHEGPWFALMNGRAAVIVFFVLSGFVLTHAYFTTRDRSIIIHSVLKRWPRLLPLALISTLISFVFASISVNIAKEAASEAGSTWLNRATFSGDPNFLDAVLQGSIFVFFRGAPGDFSYNSNLWTMWWEMMGSFTAFAAALILGAEFSKPLKWGIFTALLVVTVLWSPNIAAFTAGVLLSYAASTKPRTISLSSGLVLCIFGLAMLSYTRFGWLSFLSSFGLAPYRHYVYIVGAACLVTAFYFCISIRDFMSKPIFAFLGRISFALYVIHLPVIALIGSAAYLSFGAVAAIVAVAGVSLIAAVPLTSLDEWWLRQIKSMRFIRATQRLLPTPTVETAR